MKILLVGIGTLGYKLAYSLAISNHDITVADTDIKVLEKIKKELNISTVKTSGIEADGLRALYVSNFDLAIVSTDSDETNIICCSMLKELGCTRVLACIRDPEFVRQQAFIQEMMDIDYIVNPDMATSNEIAGFLLKDFPFYNAQPAEGRIMLMELSASAILRWNNKQLKDIKVPVESVIVAIKRNDQTIIPNSATRIEPNDILYMVGNSYHLKDFMTETGVVRKDPEIHKAMIIGGGKMGYYVASNLLKKGIKVKIIERDAARCEYLSQNLSDNALIINGDGSNINLLRDEEFDLMDAFIGVTGHDEENLLMTLMAKRRGVGRVTARVSHSNYMDIIERLGVDGGFSTTDITAREILKYIRGRAVLACSRLLGEDVEVTEVLVDKKMPITNRPISQLKIPEGIILGALLKKDCVLIPKSSTVIEAGDKLVTFSLIKMRQTLKDFLYKNI